MALAGWLKSWHFPGNVEQQGALFRDRRRALLGAHAMATFRGTETVAAFHTQPLQLAIKDFPSHGQGSAEIDKTDEVMGAGPLIQLVEYTIKVLRKMARHPR